MPKIIVTADDAGERVLHSERVTESDFATDHFRAQLAERVAWAVADAPTPAEDPQEEPEDSAAETRAPAHAV